MVHSLLAADAPNTIFVADCNVGVYRGAQVSYAQHSMWYSATSPGRCDPCFAPTAIMYNYPSGLDWSVTWTRTVLTHAAPTLPCDPLLGRVLFVRLTKCGFRPLEVYLFTMLTDAECYPVEDVVVFYGLRWQVEVAD